MTFLFFLILVVIVMLLISGNRSKKLQTRDARSMIWSRQCPNCRMIIDGRARICRHCHESTGFSAATRAQDIKDDWTKIGILFLGVLMLVLFGVVHEVLTKVFS
jgi:hypothetical protein